MLEVNSNDADVLVGLAEAYIAQGQIERGREYFERAAGMPVPWTYMYQNLARVHAMLGQHREALEHVELALRAGFDRSAFEEDLWLDALRDDPRWSEMLERVEG